MLIKRTRHYDCMFGLVLIPLFAVAALLVYALGADSRVDDVARRRRFHG